MNDFPGALFVVAGFAFGVGAGLGFALVQSAVDLIGGRR